MFTIDRYVKVQSLSEAYELAQKKTATILGGCGWLKMGRRPIQTAIDLSGLGLDQIQETDGYFELGCMATLRQIEMLAAHCRRAVPQLRHNRRLHLGALRLLRPADPVPRAGRRGVPVPRRRDAAAGLCTDGL